MARKRLAAGTLLILIMGVVSLFADFTYEGGRSIVPQFFTGVLGGSVFLLGVVLGFGEFIGYALRLVSGKVAEKTKRYWSFVFSGYALELLVIPALALSGNYVVAAVLILAERTGKAIRTPSGDYIISLAARQGKMGRAFAIREGLDQLGAIIGPIVVSLMIFYSNSYQMAFGTLIIPALISLSFLVVAYRYFKRRRLGNASLKRRQTGHVLTHRQFLIYSVGVAISAAGLYNVAFVLVAAQGVIQQYLIPLIFLAAMIGEGVLGPIFGLLYDRVGNRLVFAGLALSALVPVALLFNSPVFFFVSGVLYGAVVGVQETVMKATVGSMVEKNRRSYAFGIFGALYGFGLLVADSSIGALYSSLAIVVCYVIVAQVVAAIAIAKAFAEPKKEAHTLSA